MNNKTDFNNKVSNQESSVVAIDFDGVIHKNSLGFHDGTVYDEMIDGAYESLEKLSKKYSITIFTCKALPDRPLINGKTGTDLIWQWLEDNKINHFITNVTCVKPRALFYIDDKGIRFENWQDTMRLIYEE